MPHTIYADLHTHSVFSQHAFSTVKENLDQAHFLGMDFIACTDHLYLSDSPTENGRTLSRFVGQKKHISNAISGIELNLCETMSASDKLKIEENVPWRLLGNHKHCVTPNRNKSEIPEEYLASLNSADRPRPTAFAHIERGLKAWNGPVFEPDVSVLYDIVGIAVENDIFLEINENSLKNYPGLRDVMKAWVTYAVQSKAKLCLGTDAHYYTEVGDFSETKQFIQQLNVNKCYILNYDLDAIQSLMK